MDFGFSDPDPPIGLLYTVHEQVKDMFPIGMYIVHAINNWQSQEVKCQAVVTGKDCSSNIICDAQTSSKLSAMAMSLLRPSVYWLAYL